MAPAIPRERITIGRSASSASTSCRANSFAAPCRERAVYVRPSTVASAIQTQAEFGVRVVSSGRQVTSIRVT
jgi:hypothetical protein